MALPVPIDAAPVAPAMVVPPTAPIAAARAPPIIYRELLTDESNSPRPDRMANSIHGCRFDGGGVPAPATNASIDFYRCH